MAAKEFINALRRFAARRGLPESITCDNAPTFLLAANILGPKQQELNTETLHAISNREIKWDHITPYAPWQGGFYERLIKSIKHAIYKALRGGKQHSFDDFHTIITEVEACLNSRPLTYQGSMPEEMSSVRPIDFLQKDITLLLPNITVEEDDNDPSYRPPEELRQIKYRQQVIDALTSSWQKTERFWKIWQEQYLTSLREVHKKFTTNRRLGHNIPTVGDVVLVSDPVLPRNEWKLARITNTKQGADGGIREAELITANRRKIRRPVNLLVPLEIQEADKITIKAATMLNRGRVLPLQIKTQQIQQPELTLITCAHGSKPVVRRTQSKVRIGVLTRQGGSYFT
ncbi:unnamed protein product [Heligmosomoides polygyrus]|uniref:Integrase catalytic domain-containing protein n=1 Tax=Heligmosomoides polygyrus TaxID=6339 RepID=A0A183GDR9_HELPZ|nr:unnamed protein product [Heligmosomoides polygyrus]